MPTPQNAYHVQNAYPAKMPTSHNAYPAKKARRSRMPAICQHYASISENASIPASIFGKYHDGVPQLPAKRRVGIFAEQVKHFPVSATMQLRRITEMPGFTSINAYLHFIEIAG